MQPQQVGGFRIVKCNPTRRHAGTTGKGPTKNSIFALIVLMAYSAPAQVISGTIIVFNFTKDGSVVAADSLAGNKDTGSPDYYHCKVAAFCHKLIFASVGNSGWSNSSGKGLVQAWDNIELARNAIHSTQGGECGADLDNITTQWAKDVKSHWDLVDQVDRQQARNIAAANNGQFTAGMFVGKGLSVKVAVIGYSANKLVDPVEIGVRNGDAITSCWPCGQLRGGRICGAGVHLDVAAKFCSKRKHRDKIDIRTPLRGASESTKLAVKIVEMTIDDYEKTAKDVGGAVDTVTISKDGKIAWNSRKKNCPQNQD